MRTDILIIGGGASGLMAAWAAADSLAAAGSSAQVTVLEKMPRPARKIMITGKGRCNMTNVKDWNEFCTHIRSKAQIVKPAFYNFTPEKLLGWFESYGLKTVVERGDRAFPASYHASDVIDTLVNACHSKGVKIETGCEVTAVRPGYEVELSDGRIFTASKLIIATGGLSYPGTGSTGDGLRWAGEVFGHRIVPTFPSLTALVPRGYKETASKDLHINRELPMTDFGQKLCGMHLENVGATLLVEGCEAQDEFGDIDFTDGGLEGPVGFQLSRKAVKSLIGGSRVSVVIDMKHGVSLTELTARVKELWQEIDKDRRSANLREKEKCRIMLGKLMPWDLIPAFVEAHPEIMTLERRGRADTKVWINLVSIAKALKEWKFDIAGYVGYERAVVTAGGVSTEEVLPKTLESRIAEGLYFCGEVLDMDCDTGGYNLQCAFCTGFLAGQSAAKSLL